MRRITWETFTSGGEFGSFLAIKTAENLLLDFFSVLWPTGQTWWTHPILRERNLPITDKIVCCWSSNKKSSEKPLPCYYPVSDLSCHDSLSCSSWLMSIYTCWQLSSGVFAFWRNGEADSWILINKYYFGIILLRCHLPIIWLRHQEPLIYIGSFPASTI